MRFTHGSIGVPSFLQLSRSAAQQQFSRAFSFDLSRSARFGFAQLTAQLDVRVQARAQEPGAQAGSLLGPGQGAVMRKSLRRATHSGTIARQQCSLSA